MRLFLCLFALVGLLAGCAEPVWAPDEAVARARYVSDEPSSITLFTVVRRLGGEGAHSGLLINGSQRVMFDPAGTWSHPSVPERNDLHFGISPRIEQYYIDYHARETFDVYRQTVYVSPEVAEMAIQRAMSRGAVGKALCGNSISSILRGLPGFETVPHSFFPGRIMDSFSQMPGVRTEKFEDTDPDDNKPLLAQQVRLTP